MFLTHLVPFSNNRIFLFSTACLSGFLFAFVWHLYVNNTVTLSTHHQPFLSLAPPLHNTNYETWFKSFNLSRTRIPEELLSFHVLNDSSTEASFLYNKTAVFCAIFVKSLGTAKAIKATWSTHCNHRTFFGPVADDTIPIVHTPRTPNFEIFCQHYLPVWRTHEAQWTLLVDGRTFAIVENLRYYVAALNSSRPYYLGYAVKTFSTTFNLMEGGVVLSRGAMALLAGEDSCSRRRPMDQGLGETLLRHGVVPLDTRDKHSRGRFNPFPVSKMLLPSNTPLFNTFWRSSLFPSPKGGDCCSRHAVTFHGVSCSELYLLNYLAYRLVPFVDSPQGLGNLPPPPSPSQKPQAPSVGRALVHPLPLGQRDTRRECP